MSSRDLRALVASAKEELASRSADDIPDLPALATRMMQVLFTDIAVVGPQVAAPGVIALGGMVQEVGSSNRHKCHLFTVMPDGEDSTEMWAWDESLETHVYSDTSKVDKVRFSVSLHAALEGMLIVRHKMSSDGFKHSRTSVDAWRVTSVNEDGDVRIESLHHWVPRTLPPPHASAGSSASRLVRR